MPRENYSPKITTTFTKKKSPSEMKSKVELNGREPPGHGLINGNSSNDLEELEEEDDSDSSSPTLPYLQAPPPDGCCTQDGKYGVFTW